MMHPKPISRNALGYVKAKRKHSKLIERHRAALAKIEPLRLKCLEAEMEVRDKLMKLKPWQLEQAERILITSKIARFLDAQDA